MPTIISHPVVALALIPIFRARPPFKLLLVGGLLSIVPDLDVAAFNLGIPYAHPLGHRGFTHSLAFAAIAGCLGGWFWRRVVSRELSFPRLSMYFAVCIATHGVLDALTDGGKGVGFFIPIDNGRYFFPWRPIEVSPIGVSGFLERGWPVLRSELYWVWLPSLTLGVAASVYARMRARNRAAG